MLDFNLDFNLLDYEDEPDFKNDDLLNDEDIEVKNADSSCSVRNEVKSFRDLLLKQELLRAINDCGFESPSSVQNQCIPQAIMGIDILCQAKSGMGKTCVFVLSTLQQLDLSINKVMVLVLCHTRELAFQISKEYERFSKYIRANVAVFFGGIPQRLDEQVLAINRPHIVVSTSGRLCALIKAKKIDLSCVRHFVVDECDKMLGHHEYLDDLIKINAHLPKDKQVMMFSATISQMMRITAKKFMEKPLEVYIGDDSRLVLHGLQQFYVELTEREKLRKCFDLLQSIEYKQCIIFVQTIKRCNAMADIFEKYDLSVIRIHGGLSQEQRLIAYETFKGFKRRILVVTKMFDRGVDFERVNLVINFDMADNSDTYLHAVGRAGRFGTKGVAISFITTYEDKVIRKQVQTRFNITLEQLPERVII